MPLSAILPDTAENRALAANVHPAGWVNPQPAPRYNLVVVGAGTAGLVTAAGAAALGAKVALVERDLMGGDCLNTGCVPSKGIIRSARALFDVRDAARFGVRAGADPSLDFEVAMTRMRKVRSELSGHDGARRFRDELGVDVFLGSGRFVSEECLEVGGRRLFFRKGALCTGARAKAPDIPGLAEAGYLTNETVFSLERLPRRLAVVGAGPVGCELAQTFCRFGSAVTLVASGKQILPREDADAAELLSSVFIQEGMAVRFGAKLLRVELAAGEKVLHCEASGRGFEVRCDEILIAVGRAPNVEGLDLERAGIAYGPDGVKVDATLRTSNPRVYAAGDICSPYKFTHMADAQARLLIANALFLGRRKSSAVAVPWCTYTDPEVAHVGIYAKEGDAEVRTLTVPLAEVDRAALDGEEAGFARVHLQAKTGRVLGATLVARHAGEMVSELTLAIQNGLKISALGNTIHPYPTQAEAIRKLADAYNRGRLTPRVKRFLSAWLSWQRR